MLCIYTTSMPYAKANGIRIYFERVGKGHPLLLIGDCSSDISWWEPVRKHLSRRFDLILFDNRGSGRTTRPQTSFTLEQMAKDTLALIDHLQLSKPHILGQSMGGAIAQILAYRHPEKIGKVILSQTYLKLRPVPEAAIRATLHKAPLRQRIKASMPWLFSNRFMADKKKREAFIHKIMTNAHATPLPSQIKQLNAAARFNSTSWYRKIASPTLVLAGDEDSLCPLYESLALASGIPNAKFHVFPRISHNAPHEIPDTFSQQILKFLQ